MGTCSGVGRSTPLNPIFARILHRSSNDDVEPFPQTDAITLCLMGMRARAGVGAGEAGAGAGRRAVTNGTAATLVRKSLLSMAALYFLADDLSASDPISLVALSRSLQEMRMATVDSTTSVESFRSRIRGD